MFVYSCPSLRTLVNQLVFIKLLYFIALPFKVYLRTGNVIIYFFGHCSADFFKLKNVLWTFSLSFTEAFNFIASYKDDFFLII